jgi:Uma2 family endonuclease
MVSGKKSGKRSLKEPPSVYGDLDLRKRYTWLDYLGWDLKERVELIRGKAVKMSPAPSTNHQMVAAVLYKTIIKSIGETTCQWFPAPFDVRLPSSSGKDNVVQPDACVVCDSHKLDERGCNGAPDLIMEIVSAGNSNHDTKTKFALYEESGVREYWIVNPVQKHVRIFCLEEGKYTRGAILMSGHQAQSRLFPNLYFQVDEIFSNLIPTEKS